jgi:Na+/melibiose symporter-like transporter
MASLAELSSAPQRKILRCRAYAAACFGGFADLLLDNSAIIILYFAMLHAGSSLTMFSTSLTGIAGMTLLIPASGIVDRFGPQQVVKFACTVSCIGHIFTACAPFFGSFAKYAALLGIILICFPKPLWTAAWYPVLGQILLPEERADFFGFMRFSYNILTGGAFFIIALIMGKNPPMLLLQIIIAAFGILMLGRGYFVASIPLPPHIRQNYDLKKSFSISIKNSPLIGFAVYVCFMMLAFSPVLPLTMIYLKRSLDLPDNMVQMISSIGIAGCVCAYFFYGRIVKKTGIRNLELIIHLSFVRIPLALAFCRGFTGVEYVIGLLFLGGNFVYGCFFCAFSQEILALARPGNVTMANALGNTYMQIGSAAGRSATSFMLGCGALSASWTMWGLPFSDFQAIFLLCSGLAFFALILIFCLPSVVPLHDDYYAP